MDMNCHSSTCLSVECASKSKHSPNVSDAGCCHGATTDLRGWAGGSEAPRCLRSRHADLAGWRAPRHRRTGIREAWVGRAQVPGVSLARFILSEDERTPQVQGEVSYEG